MSWLNFNDSLNNIKGQLSNFASGVLTDGIANDTDLSSNNRRVEDLENLVTSQVSEIEVLRKQNEELRGKLTKRQSLNGTETVVDHEKRDDWFWDTYGADQVEISSKNTDLVAELRKKIEDLENDKAELVVSLEQLDLDCQQTTEKIVNLKDAIQTDYNKLKLDYDSLRQEKKNWAASNAENLRTLRELREEKPKLLNNLEDLKSSIAARECQNNELQIQLDEAKNKNNSLQNELKSCPNEDTLDEFKAIKEALQVTSEEKNHLAKELEELMVEKSNCDSKLSACEQSHLISREEYNKLALILQGYEEQVRTCKKQYQLVKNENDQLKQNALQMADSIEIVKLNNAVPELRGRSENLVKEKNSLHKKYVDLLTETFKKFMDYSLVVEDKDVIPNDDPEVSEYITIVEVILKLLLDLKWKTETLKKEVDDLTEEKTKIITDKNYEIEKLINNSEILSQEVITKSQTLKHYEAECSELMKNNDLLINELENYKSNSGLQTISESNEDNMLLLESQLENANKRIKDLELTVSDLENSKQDANLEVQSELEYIKMQLNLTGTELSQTKHEYQELFKKYAQEEVDHKNLQNDYEELKTSYDDCCNEKQNLNSTVDKIQSEFENTEYKYSEMNMDMESLKEEIETLKAEIDGLTKTNKKLERLNMNYESENELVQNEVVDLKQQLTSEIESREQHEMQIRNLTEKLQNAKMFETGLKLQNDTICKELQSVTEAKQNVDIKCSYLMSNLSEAEAGLRKVQEENLFLKQKCSQMEVGKVELEKLLRENEEMSRKLTSVQENFVHYEEQVKVAQDHNYEKLLASNEDLLAQLKISEQKIGDLQKTSGEESMQRGVDFKDTVANLNDQLENAMQENASLRTQADELKQAIAHSICMNNEYLQKIETLEAHLNDLTMSRNDLINLVTTKHQESIQYHNEIQRINQVLALETEKCKTFENQLKHLDDKLGNSENLMVKIEEVEKLTDQNNFLREKCEVLAQNLLQEQSTVQKLLSEKNDVTSEKEVSLTKELERLRAHLLEIEDMYTKELLAAEARNQEMQAKVNEIEQREKDSSTLYTSVNIRTNQQVETLQNQLQLITSQRDELRKKISDAEDQIGKQTAALSNLQFVLEQFQKDKEKDVYHGTERIRRQINVEKQIQQDLQNEITSLKAQLGESKQGLLAASRLAEQLDSSKQQLLNMKDEVSKLQQKLEKSEEKYNSLISHTDAKVDKMLVKNLVVGFVSANSNYTKDQQQMLKLIATVLDFNQQDNEKVHLNKQQGSWLSSILHPQSVNSHEGVTQESLSQAFVRFLENESKPRQLPNLLESANPNLSGKVGENSGAGSRQSPILLSEVVLPTFADFRQNRSSSSILKDVLKDNN